MKTEITRIGKRGTVVIPSALRHYYNFHEGDMLIAEQHAEGLLLKPVIVLPFEKYSQERQAEFLLSNAVDARDYQQARKEVKKMGLDPDKIPHHKPTED